MTNEEIEEGNKSMAIFLGLKSYFEYSPEGSKDYWWSKSEKEFMAFKGLHWPSQNPPPFDNSWEWLMNVYEKIENVSEMSPSLNFGCGVVIHTDGSEKNKIQLFSESSTETNVFVAWRAALKYIDYYHEVIRTRKVLIEKT